MIVDRKLTAAEAAATPFGASQGTEYIGPYGHCANCDEIATLDLVTGWSFLEEKEFDALFLDDGPALVAAMRLQCCPGQVWSMEFAGDLLELTERNRGPQHEYCLRTGESFWSQT